MMNDDIDYLAENLETELDEEVNRPIQRRYTNRRRPEYFKKQAPVRRGANQRSNYRCVR